jgi:hypothetical protein
MESWGAQNGVVECLHAGITLISGQIKVKGRIRLRIKVKRRIRIRIKAMRIRKTDRMAATARSHKVYSATRLQIRTDNSAERLQLCVFAVQHSSNSTEFTVQYRSSFPEFTV